MILDKELELQLKREIFTTSYFEFFKWAFNILFPNEKYEDAFHIKYLCDLYQVEVERIIKREEKDKDIIVNIPPRTSKSLITSVVLNAWAWIKDPTIPFITVSFDEDLSLLNARYCKDIIKSDEYQALFGHLFQIRKDADTQSLFFTDKGGFRMSKTTGANITGHKGMIIIVDDPQNPKTAESELERKKTIEYYTRALYNRLTPANLGIRIIIMQRLHENDLTGYLLENNKEDYIHICLPAEISDLVKPVELRDKYSQVEFATQEGTRSYFLLDPIRLGMKTLSGFKKTLGTRGYTGQYDQRPAPEEGGIFKREWFEIVDPETIVRDVQNESIHAFIDGAYTDKTQNDPSAKLDAFRQGNFLYIVNVEEQWMEAPALMKYLKQHIVKYQHDRNSKMFIEPKASGKTIAQMLRDGTMFNVIETKPPDKDKVTRANAVSPICESKRVKLINGPYVEKFLQQVTTFPNATHDDMVDVLVMAILELLFNNNPDFFFV
jgi:predicted phage terminase large subunit-like protein